MRRAIPTGPKPTARPPINESYAKLQTRGYQFEHTLMSASDEKLRDLKSLEGFKDLREARNASGEASETQDAIEASETARREIICAAISKDIDIRKREDVRRRGSDRPAPTELVYAHLPCDRGVKAAVTPQSNGNFVLDEEQPDRVSVRRVLVVGADAAVLIWCQEALQQAGLVVFAAASGQSAAALLHPEFCGAVVVGMRLPDMDGLQFLQLAEEVAPGLPVILITGSIDTTLGPAALQAGAYDLIEDLFSPIRLVGVVGRALEKRRLTFEVEHLRRLHRLPPKVPAGATLSGAVEDFERSLIAADWTARRVMWHEAAKLSASRGPRCTIRYANTG